MPTDEASEHRDEGKRVAAEEERPGQVARDFMNERKWLTETRR